MGFRVLASISSTRSLPRRTLVRCSSRWYVKLRQEADTWPSATCGAASSVTPVLPPASAESLRVLAFANLPPLHLEAPGISEQRPPPLILHVHTNPKALRLIVIPLADFRNARKEHGEPEPDRSFIEPLLPTSEPQSAILGHRHIKIHRKVDSCQSIRD